MLAFGVLTLYGHDVHMVLVLKVSRCVCVCVCAPVPRTMFLSLF